MNFLLAFVTGFGSGILFRSLFVSGWWPMAGVFTAALLLGALAHRTRRRKHVLAAVFLACAALGMGRVAISESPLPQPFASELTKRVSYEGVVVGDPDLRDSTERVPVRVKEGSARVTLLAVAPRTETVHVGDRVFVSGTLEVPEPFAGDNGRIFRYDKYLEKDGIRFMLDYAYLRVESPAPWYSIPAALARVKHAFLIGLDRALPEPYASLAGGIVIGGKSGLGTDLQNAFVKSGLVQIIVLSGYNVMVVAEWVMAAFAFLKLPRRLSAAAGALALLLFVGIAGVSATAVRAALMALIALYARATGRSYAASRALLVAVFLMLLWNPLFLAFDPGFDLSVAATAGLIWLAPRIEKRFRFITNAFWKNAVATTLAAQIAVLPLLLYFTGNLSFVAIPANLLVMPIVPAAMGFSALAGVVGMLSHSFLAILAGFPAYLAAEYLLFIAQTSAALPGAALLVQSFPFWAVCAAYAVLVYLATSSKRFSTTLQLRLSRKAST